MQNIASLAAEIKPLVVYCYVDRAQLWLRYPLTAAQIAWLKSLCKGKLHIRNKHVVLPGRRLVGRQREAEGLTEPAPGQSDVEITGCDPLAVSAGRVA